MQIEQQEALRLRESGLSRPAIAAKMNKTERQVKSLLERARQYLNAPEGQRAAVSNAGLDLSSAKHGWRKVKNADGSSDSVFWKAEEAGRDEWLSTVVDAFKDIPAYQPKEVTLVDNELMVVFPLYDLHAGMYADAAETRGPEYNLDLFKSDLIASVSRINARVPASGHALVVLGGDVFHVNDYSNKTPGHGHVLDVDGRFEKIADIAIEAVCHAIEEVASRHSRVSVVVLRGNHCEASHVVLKAALKQRYRDSQRIQFATIHDAPRSEIFWTKHGKTLIACHHGDRMKPQTLAMICADQCDFWSSTRHRAILTGHRHHLRVEDMPGVTHYTMRAFSAADAYGSSFGSVRGLQAMVFDESHGLVAQFHDSIWRDE